MPIRSYEDLHVWLAGMDLVDAIYSETREFPLDERYGLTAQMRRAAVSVVANIAEGHGRAHRGEFLHHLSFAAGSLAELETQARVATRQGFLSAESLSALLMRTGDVGRMLRRLRQALAMTRNRRTS